MSEQGKVHLPVMLSEVLSLLNPTPGRIYLDMTLGAGGHAQGVLEKMQNQGTFIGLDRDAEILKIASENLSSYSICHFCHSPFSKASDVLKKMSIPQIDGVLFDLGVSSLQLDQSQRGFSFQKEGPLDMRMDKSQEKNATDILNKYSEEELVRIFREFGEESRAFRFARAIVEARKKFPLKSTLQLAQIINQEVSFRKGKIHPATKVFQALRIETNRELEELTTALDAITRKLAPGGRIVIISFHSLEDRIAKQFFKKKSSEGVLEILTSKPTLPTREETRQNPRSRSAKVRCAQRTST